MPGVSEAREKFAKALDIKDEVNSRDPVLCAAVRLTDEVVEEAASSPRPRLEALDRALETKDRLAKFGVNVAEEEGVWKEELEEGVRELEK